MTEDEGAHKARTKRASIAHKCAEGDRMVSSTKLAAESKLC